MISSSVPANTEKYIRSWFARIVAVDVRSANRSSCCSLIRFSISPRAQYSSSYSCLPATSSRLKLVTTKRGFAPRWPGSHSALPTTLRCRPQLCSVR